MSTEKEILERLNTILTEVTNSIYNAKIDMDNINNSINILENNYFVEDSMQIYCKIQNTLNSKNLEDFINLLINYKYTIEHKINNICEHEWIEDDIDINLELSQRIVYCKWCQVSKKK